MFFRLHYLYWVVRMVILLSSSSILASADDTTSDSDTSEDEIDALPLLELHRPPPPGSTFPSLQDLALQSFTSEILPQDVGKTLSALRILPAPFRTASFNIAFSYSSTQLQCRQTFTASFSKIKLLGLTCIRGWQRFSMLIVLEIDATHPLAKHFSEGMIIESLGKVFPYKGVGQKTLLTKKEWEDHCVFLYKMNKFLTLVPSAFRYTTFDAKGRLIQKTAVH